jgi:hypothetical protein
MLSNTVANQGARWPASRRGHGTVRSTRRPQRKVAIRSGAKWPSEVAQADGVPGYRRFASNKAEAADVDVGKSSSVARWTEEGSCGGRRTRAQEDGQRPRL